jgi:hypothetical protein
MNSLTLDNVGYWLRTCPQWIAFRVSDKAKAWIEDLAQRRADNGDRQGWKSKTPGDSREFHVAGAAAEWMVCHVYAGKMGCLYSNFSGDLNRFGDVCVDGHALEVKSSRSNSKAMWSLVENEDKFKRFPFMHERPYVHCITCLYPEILILTGWAWGRDVAQGKVFVARAGHRIVVLDQSKLREPLSLHRHLRIEVPEVVTVSKLDEWIVASKDGTSHMGDLNA